MFQRRVKKANTRTDPMSDAESVGNILIRMGVITKAQLLEALGQKAYHDDMLLGAVLKQQRMANDRQVAQALSIQAKMRSGERALAELELLETRVQQFAEGERALGQQIEQLGVGERELFSTIEACKKERRANGDHTATWLSPVTIKL